MTKICIKCKIEKKLTEFYKYKTSKDGLCNSCKKCQSEYSKETYKKNPYKIIERTKKWQKDNPEKTNEKNKKWKKNHLESVNKYNKKWRKDNPEKVREIEKRYAKNHPEKIREKNRKWAKNNPDRLKELSKKSRIKRRKKRNLYNCNKRKTDIHFKLRSNTSSSINKRLRKRSLSKKGKSIITFLPYTIDDLKKHLESQFEPWMTWENWGDKAGCWSIDHIKPDSSFSYTSVEDEEFQKCWALSNLQPMEHIKNIKKSNKIILQS